MGKDYLKNKHWGVVHKLTQHYIYCQECNIAKLLNVSITNCMTQFTKHKIFRNKAEKNGIKVNNHEKFVLFWNKEIF